MHHISQVIEERWGPVGRASYDPGKAAITFREWEKIKNRLMKITRAPTTDALPMLRIANRFLLQSGFRVGSQVSVEYAEGVLTITLKN